MSTIKVTNIEHESTGNGGIQLDNAGHVTVDGVQMPTAGAFSNRNLIINGDQRIDQRNNGSAVTTSSSYPVDRFLYSHSSNGAFSGQRSTEAPTGFQFSTKTTTTTADTSISGTQRLLYFTKLEDTNLNHLEYGTVNAKTVTLSFWVRSSVTGTFSGSLQNGFVNRSYPYDYTINAADTWEYKTITIPGDTSGTWTGNNGVSHQVFWSLGISSSNSATAGAWTNGQIWGSTTGTANILTTLNATWYVTGVQLEVGEKATPFEHRSYGDELQRCERYFQTYGQVFGLVFSNYTNTNGYGSLHLRTQMRTNPTVYHLEAHNSSHLNYYSNGGSGRTLNSFTLNQGRPHVCQFAVSSSDLGGQGNAAHMDINQTDAIQFQAEL
tara:strand:+ start:190 stop:1329 length:1140 start_codon:yes stop_codon:yes gene_type:complete